MEEIGRTPQGVRGLKLSIVDLLFLRVASHSARSAWIETKYRIAITATPNVALRKECVD